MKLINRMAMTGTSLVVMTTMFAVGCAHNKLGDASPEEAAKIDRKLVRNAVSFSEGAEAGAVVPDVSSPCLRAEIVPERVERDRLIEAHRQWILECDVRLIGLPNPKKK